MLNHEVRDGKITFKGDLENGQQMAITARSLFKRSSNYFAAAMADAAQQRIVEYQNVRRAVAENPERFHIAPIYGPFTVRAASMSEVEIAPNAPAISPKK